MSESDQGSEPSFEVTDVSGRTIRLETKGMSPKGIFTILCSQYGITNYLDDLTLQQVDDMRIRLGRLVDDWMLRNPARMALDSRQRDGIASAIKELRRSLNERRFVLALQESMEQIKDAVESKVVDPEVRKDLIETVDESVKKQDEIVAARKASEADMEIQKHRIALQREKIDNYKSMFEREPAAVLIGGFLILLLTIVLVVAMFCHTPVPEVLTSMVLLILGFFFGQTTSGRKSYDS